MQAEIQTKVKISVSEIKKILAEKFCLYHDFELEIVEDSVVESEAVKQDNEGWIDVPKDWSEPCCPTDCKIVDIECRGGWKDTSVDPTNIDISWVQEDCNWDIIRYRVVR